MTNVTFTKWSSKIDPLIKTESWLLKISDMVLSVLRPHACNMLRNPLYINIDDKHYKN